MWVLMPSICSQAPAAESSQTNCLDIELLARSKSKNIPEKFCLHGNLTADCLDSLFGITSQRSQSITQIHEATLSGCEKGEGNSSFVAGSPSFAKTSASPEKAPASTASAPDSGEKWRESWARYDPATCSWKTRQLSLLGDSEPFSATWPRSGLMRHGECYPLPTSVPRICESESGLWPTSMPTPNARDYKGSPGAACMERGGRQSSLPAHVARWPTSMMQDNAQIVGQYKNPKSGTTLEREANQSGVSGRLNPEFVEWLMGWPIGHTGLEPVAMDRWHEWLRQHSPNFLER